MSAARQRVLRMCGCTGGGNSPRAVQRQTVRALIDNRRATSRTVSKSGVIARCSSMERPEENKSFREDRAGIGRREQNQEYYTYVHDTRGKLQQRLIARNGTK